MKTRNPKQKELETETKNELIDKLIKEYRLHSSDIAEVVELYYDAQELRIKHANKLRTEGGQSATEAEAEKELPLKGWLKFWLAYGEKLILEKLTLWIESDEALVQFPEAIWAYQQVGIGPVIACGLAAHIDVTKASTPSAVCKFSGFAPGYDRRVKGQKLPYNSRLKLVCWKAGESFVKVCSKEGAFYGKLYSQFKGDEVSRNENGLYQKQAKEELAAKKFRSDTVTKKRLQEGKLSDAHLHARAKRRTIKIFLQHYWLKGRQARGLPTPDPYSKDILGHSGIIEPQ